jgi:hypothetical protein
MPYGLMVKKQEARSRMAAVRKARRSPQAAAEQRIRLTGYVQPEARNHSTRNHSNVAFWLILVSDLNRYPG